MAPRVKYGAVYEISTITPVAGGVIAYGTGASGRMGRIKWAGIFFLERLSMNYRGVVNNDGTILHAEKGEPSQGKYPTYEDLLKRSPYKTVQEILDKNRAYEKYKAREPQRRALLEAAFPEVVDGQRLTNSKGDVFIITMLIVNTKGEVVPALKLNPTGYGFERYVSGEEADAFLKDCGVRL